MKLYLVIALFVVRAMTSPTDEDSNEGEIVIPDDAMPSQYILSSKGDLLEELSGGSAPVGCYWDGTAPYCDGHCSPGYKSHGHDRCGDGFCCWSGIKMLCCKEKEEDEE
ncbi:hypothetical protein CPC08DRAFT_796744 [Agrocybe pediades]|nr:hypothetical protein CPC08DRAFT_796744 [Agrocybe pediades]